MIVIFPGLIAQKAKELVEDPRVILLTGLLVVVLFLGAFVIGIADRWRKRQMEGREAPESLTSFRALYEAGEISEEEYQHIKKQVAQRIHRKVTADGEPKPSTLSSTAPPIDLASDVEMSTDSTPAADRPQTPPSTELPDSGLPPDPRGPAGGDPPADSA